jgi:hypothetical protein
MYVYVCAKPYMHILHSQYHIQTDWMHDTACGFGYPSDSSRTARKRAGTLGWAGLRSASPPPTRNPRHSSAGARRRHLRHRPRPPRAAGRGATRRGQLGPGGQDNPTATGPGPLVAGTVLTVSLPWCGGGRCPPAIGYWCLVGCPGLRRIASTFTTAGLVRGGSGWWGLGRSGHGWIATSTARGGCGSVGPDLTLACLLGGSAALS